MVTGITQHREALGALGLFEMEPTARASRPLPFSPQNATKIPELHRPFGRRHCTPLHASPAPAEVDISEFVAGAALLGFEPSPHQERFARIMAATGANGLPRYRRVAKTEPRRSGKTEGLWALVVGRATARPEYHVGFSAQNGKKGRARFLAMAVKLERWDPCPRPRPNAPGCTRDHVHYRIYRSNGGERIEWANGSTLDVLPPDAESYRGDEYDLVVLDEGQEMEDDDAASELLGGINPTMDTKPAAQLVVAGTAGKRRSGLLWSSLVKGRAGSWGILEYAAADHADPTDEATWLCHPGIGTLTTLDIIRENYNDLSLIDFQREYLGQWPADASVSAIDAAEWAAGRAEFTARPRRIGLAFDVAPDGSNAGIVAAWRDEDGVAYVELLAFRAGVAWLPAEAHRIARESRAAVAYDVVGANTNPADSVHRRRPVVKLAPQRLADMQGATQRLVSELAEGRLRHFDQKDMNLAAEGANWRYVGEGGRLFGHKASTNSIVPLTAAALALWQYDKASGARRTARTKTTRTVTR